jgi:hypothetical protein
VFAQIKKQKSNRKSSYSEIWAKQDNTLFWDLDARNHEIIALTVQVIALLNSQKMVQNIFRYKEYFYDVYRAIDEQKEYNQIRPRGITTNDLQ